MSGSRDTGVLISIGPHAVLPESVMRSIVSLLTATLLAVVSAPASAYVICVDTSAELAQAIAQAAGDSDDTEIRIVAGDYVPPTAAGWVFSPIPFDLFTDLEISGGWLPNGNCSTQLFDSTLTRLNGSDSRRLLTIHRGNGNTGKLNISRLSFVHAFTASDDPFATLGLALYVDGTQHFGPVLIEHVIVRDNASLHGRYAMYVSSKGVLRVRNNLIVDNESGDGSMGLGIDTGNASYITGNTIADNTTLTPGTVPAGLSLIAGAGFTAAITNNIVWGNGCGANAENFKASSGMLLVANAMSNVTGTGGSGSTPPLSLEPMFVGGGDYRLKAASPLHDIGVASPFGGQSIADLAGETRQLGNGTDLGAFETAFIPGPQLPDAMFKNGFE
jgi:hypothetical protein